MNEVLRIALRNVLRHKKRAFITAITMMVGIALFIGFDSMMAGLDRLSIENMINLSYSSLKIFTNAYVAERDVYPLDYGIPDPGKLAAELKNDPRVRSVTQRTEFLGELSDYHNSLPVRGIVVDPPLDAKVFTLADHISGSFFGQRGNPAAGVDPGSLAQATNPIVIGSGLAVKFNLKIGDTILLSAHTRYDAQNADEFTVIGLLSSLDPTLDDNSVFITYNTANDFLDLGNLVTETDVRLVHRVNLDETVHDATAVAAAVKSGNPTLDAQTFKELGRAYFDLMNSKRSITIALILVILLIAAVGIVNTVLMSVYSRIREVGVLKALGFRRGEVVWMFTFEGIFVGVIGSVMGAILGILIDLYLIFVGFPLDKMAGSSVVGGLSFWGTLYGTWNPGMIVFAVLFGLAVATVAAVIPARKAAKMTATAALRFV
ncbi:MAG TPA: FtsX-like permease family protein [Spirochaetia bacterium]|nr:FtsX-like permease family protein [Spirochaetia bacterium]